MAHFIYKVRDEQGRERQDAREAATEEDLIAQLQKEGLLVISVTSQDLVKKGLPAARRYHLKISIDDLIIFARQLSILLGAGVTLLKSLDVLSRQLESWRLREAVEEIKHDISGGSAFRDALAKHPNIFSEFWIHMAETGEASGTLPAALGQLAEYLESAAAIRRKVSSALIYPCVLVSLAIAALTIFVVWIIPIFSRVFGAFDLELPLLTKGVITFSNLARRYFFILFLMVAASVYLGRKYIHTEKGKRQFDYLKFRIPGLSSLFRRIAIEKFANGLGTLIESGVPILYGLDIIGKAVQNKVVEEAIVGVRESVRQGKGMAAPLEESGAFSPMVVQMVSVGEEIGELGKMLKRISDFYRERTAATLTKITTMIEPAVLIFMGLVVGVLVVAMFLPIFQLAMVHQG